MSQTVVDDLRPLPDDEQQWLPFLIEEYKRIERPFSGPWRLWPLWLAPVLPLWLKWNGAIERDTDGAPLYSSLRISDYVGYTINIPFFPGRRLALWGYEKRQSLS